MRLGFAWRHKACAQRNRHVDEVRLDRTVIDEMFFTSGSRLFVFFQFLSLFPHVRTLCANPSGWAFKDFCVSFPREMSFTGVLMDF